MSEQPSHSSSTELSATEAHQLSQLYHNEAQEKVPASLNRAVHNLAAKELRPRFNIQSILAYSRQKAPLIAGFAAVAIISLNLITPQLSQPEHAPVTEDAITDRDSLPTDSNTNINTEYTPVITPSGSNMPAAEPCSDQEKNSPGSWWSCVERLEGEGHHALAQEELLQLISQYPQVDQLK